MLGEIFMEQELRRDRNMGANLKRLRESKELPQKKLCVLLQLCSCDVCKIRVV